jgi:hypothetical protein
LLAGARSDWACRCPTIGRRESGPTGASSRRRGAAAELQGIGRSRTRGIHLELRDENEGWFPGVAASSNSGRIESSSEPVGGRAPWYVVRLDDALEIQESGHDTVSGYRLVRYERLLIRARHVGVDLMSGETASVYVCLVPEGADLLEHLQSTRRTDAWASCTLIL